MIDYESMTDKQIAAHKKKEDKLRGEMDAALARIVNNEYETKEEKLAFYEVYRASQRALDIHMGYITEDE